MFARVVMTDVSPDGMDSFMRNAREQLPDARQQPGFTGCYLLADREAGKLTRNGRLVAMIDFSAAGLGDPAQDLIVAWTLLPAFVRPAFRRAIGADDATWLCGRARALSL